MPMIICPDCGRQVSDMAPACVGCGRPFASQPVMYCSNCGNTIATNAIACPACGAPTVNYQQQQQIVPQQQPIIINNSSSSSASATSGRIPRKRSCLVDVIMILLTGGLWIIWMLLRPKYY